MAWVTVYDYAVTAGGGSAARNFRNIVAADLIAQNGIKVRVTIKAGSGSTTVDGCSIGPMPTVDDFSGVPTRITFDSGNNGVTVQSGAVKASDEIEFDYDCTKRYGIHLYCVDRLNLGFQSAGRGLYYNTPGDDDTLTQTVAYDSDANLTYGALKLEIYIDDSKAKIIMVM